jgi:hypothetical protein
VGQLLKAGYLEDWRYNNTHSGTPQGGVISPILANIYLSKLDGFVETTLIPEYTRGIKRKENLPRRRLYLKMVNRRKRGDVEEAKRYKRELRGLPAGDQHDPDYRRLKYIRYADDFILGFIGTREEAETIKERLRTFLHDELKLELSPEKTLVTHAQDKARFLGYDITTHASADRPTLNGDIDLRIPPETLEKLCSRYRKDNKSIHLPERTHDSDFDIVARYGAEYRGYVQYYRLASNIGWFNRLHYFMRGSLLKTLASKHKSSSRAMWKLYGGRAITGLKTLRCVQVVIPREGKYPLIAQFGGVPLIRERRADISDGRPKPIFTGHVELVQRLLADHCECCGSTEGVQVHHVRKLADLTRPGRAPKPFWQVVMSRRSRKTLVLCSSCHHDLHNGKPMRWSKSL